MSLPVHFAARSAGERERRAMAAPTETRARSCA